MRNISENMQKVILCNKIFNHVNSFTIANLNIFSGCNVIQQIKKVSTNTTPHTLIWGACSFLLLFFFFKFCGDKSPFCGATGTLCFRLQLTPSMGFKARVDAPLPDLLLVCN